MQRSLICYVLIRNCNTRTHLSLLQNKTIVDEDEKKSAYLNSHPSIRAQPGRCCESKNGLRHVYMCVGTKVCLSFGRERKRSALSGGKHPQRGPAFQLCESLSPHKHSQTHACHFQGLIPLQASGMKGNSHCAGIQPPLLSQGKHCNPACFIMDNLAELKPSQADR